MIFLILCKLIAKFCAAEKLKVGVATGRELFKIGDLASTCGVRDEHNSLRPILMQS